MVREGRRGSGVAPLITALDSSLVSTPGWRASGTRRRNWRTKASSLAWPTAYPLLTWAFRYRQALIAAACGAYDEAHTLTDEMLRPGCAETNRSGLPPGASRGVGSVAGAG